MQPVQDLTIEDRVSRTQFQFIARGPERRAARRVGAAAGRAAARRCRSSRDVASDLQDKGLQAFVDIDRDTASRLGVTPAAIDNALYNAFGQRLISTIFTQANQYRVVLEVDAASSSSGPSALGTDLRRAPAAGQRRSRCRSPAIAQRSHERADAARRSTTSASSRRRRSRSTSRPARRSARRSTAIEAAQREHRRCRPACRRASRARRRRSAPRSPARCC